MSGSPSGFGSLGGLPRGLPVATWLRLALSCFVAEPCCSSIVCAVPLSEFSAVKSTYAGVPGDCAGALPAVGVFCTSVLDVILFSTIGGHPLDQSSSGAVF